MSQHHAARLRCEHLENPIAIDEQTPRFAWWVMDDSPAARQTAYRVRVATTHEALTACSRFPSSPFKSSRRSAI
jgi:alpha-L-rhamnosidase